MQQLPCGSASRTPVLRSWSSWSLVWFFISPEWVWVAFAVLGPWSCLGNSSLLPIGRPASCPTCVSSIFIMMNTSPRMWILPRRPLGVELLSPSPSSPSSLILNGLLASWLGGGDSLGDFNGPSTLTFESRVSNPLACVARHLCL
jgi:hypothetical protein